ncbi:MAG: transcriptional regulator [Desulfobacteraceae bacterium]|nr:MAG: transcriptional regulator [Desulfobacteraceae bacterium]
MTARDLSKAVGISEKEVTVHLGHIERTASALGKRLVVRPFHCLSCGYRFADRRRFTRPGKCPKCRGTHVEAPAFRIL